MGEGNLSRLLRAGRSVVRPNREQEGPTCGLVPLQGRAVASTQGLKWNMGECPGALAVPGTALGYRAALAAHQPSH